MMIFTPGDIVTSGIAIAALAIVALVRVVVWRERNRA